VFAEALERLGALGIRARIGAIDRAARSRGIATLEPPEEPEAALAPQHATAGDARRRAPRLDRLGQVHLVAGQD